MDQITEVAEKCKHLWKHHIHKLDLPEIKKKNRENAALHFCAVSFSQIFLVVSLFVLTRVSGAKKIGSGLKA